MTAVDTFRSCKCKMELRSHMRRLLTLQILPRIDARYKSCGELPTLIRLTVRENDRRVSAMSKKHSRQVTVSSSIFMERNQISSDVDVSSSSAGNTTEEDLKSNSDARNKLILDVLFRLLGKILSPKRTSFNLTGLCMEFGRFGGRKKRLLHLSSSPSTLFKYFKRKLAVPPSITSTKQESSQCRQNARRRKKAEINEKEIEDMFA
mmetsp:Transcript_43944/g.73195  ORF Transcript_43944/g.73195 Transcript_43944/m.73195 type:complete len:206 (-) Transcript_43944:51-668(-)